MTTPMKNCAVGSLASAWLSTVVVAVAYETEKNLERGQDEERKAWHSIFWVHHEFVGKLSPAQSLRYKDKSDCC